MIAHYTIQSCEISSDTWLFFPLELQSVQILINVDKCVESVQRTHEWLNYMLQYAITARMCTCENGESDSKYTLWKDKDLHRHIFVIAIYGFCSHEFFNGFVYSYMVK